MQLITLQVLMTLDRRLLMFLILVMGSVIVVLIVKVNQLYKLSTYGTIVYYTDAEIIERIKQSSHYKGDSIYVDKEGRLKSYDSNMQGNLNEMYNKNENATGIIRKMKDVNQPVQYYFYEQAAFYYTTPPDSTKNKP